MYLRDLVTHCDINGGVGWGILCIGASPLALTQTTVPYLNGPEAFSGRVIILSGLFPSVRIPVRSTEMFSSDVLCRAKSKARSLDAQITAITQNTLYKKTEFTLI